MAWEVEAAAAAATAAAAAAVAEASLSAAPDVHEVEIRRVRTEFEAEKAAGVQQAELLDIIGTRSQDRGCVGRGR